MLDFINSQINGGTLLQNNSTKLNTTSSGKCIYVDNFNCNKYVLYIYIYIYHSFTKPWCMPSQRSRD